MSEVHLRVVGLAGAARCGKNYIAEQIIARMGYFPVAFAWALKNNAIGKGLCTYEQAYYLKDPVTRQLLQEEGTERGRDVFGPNVWINTVHAWMRTLQDAWAVESFVVTDCRFPNEIEFVQNLGGKVYRIDAPTRTTNSDLDARARAHRSETELNGYTGFDGVIVNDIGRTDVAAQVITLMLRDGLVDPRTVAEKWGVRFGAITDLEAAAAGS